jgi:hypothetical protein
MWVSVDWTVGHHVGDAVVVAHAHQRDQVDLARHGVDLADALEVGDRLGHLGDPSDVGLDEDDGGDHVPTLVEDGDAVLGVGKEAEQAGRRRRVETTGRW